MNTNDKPKKKTREDWVNRKLSKIDSNLEMKRQILKDRLADKMIKTQDDKMKGKAQDDKLKKIGNKLFKIGCLWTIFISIPCIIIMIIIWLISK
jgi:hypothetical protein